MTASPTTATGRPAFMAHFVIRTSRFEESVAWYRTFLGCEDVYTRDGLTFLTYDDEHHRVAIGRIPDLQAHSENVAGVDHLAFSMACLADLVLAYERNRSAGILPFWCINHGPTTSLYYRDPDGVKIEMQVDNASYPGGPKAFFKSKAFDANPIGIEFDMEELSARFHAGEDAGSLLARPDQGNFSIA